MAPEMVPALIESGHRAIMTMFDVWSIANLVKSSIQNARESMGAVEKKADGTNGTNGASK